MMMMTMMMMLLMMMITTMLLMMMRSARVRARCAHVLTCAHGRARARALLRAG
jgi:hypothetical protein